MPEIVTFIFLKLFETKSKFSNFFGMLFGFHLTNTLLYFES